MNKDANRSMLERRAQRAREIGRTVELMIHSGMSETEVANHYRMSRRKLKDIRRTWYHLVYSRHPLESLPPSSDWDDGPVLSEEEADAAFSRGALAIEDGRISACYRNGPLYLEHDFSSPDEGARWIQDVEEKMKAYADPVMVLSNVPHSRGWIN